MRAGTRGGDLVSARALVYGRPRVGSMRAALVIGACAVCCGSTAAAAGVSYVRATSQLQRAEDRGRYHPLNLLDDDPETIWCAAPGDAAEQGVDVVFKRTQRIDRVVINPTPKSGRVVAAVRISDGTRIVTVNVGTAPAAEVFSRPLEGTTFTISIAKLGAPSPSAEMPNDVVCLADTLLYLRASLFGGGGAKLRYDPKLDQLVGEWNGGALGAPEKTLNFSLDGTWDWTYTPLLGGKAKRSIGEYRFRGDRLLMRAGEVGRWTDMQYRYRRVSVDPSEPGSPAGDYDAIVLDSGLGKDLEGEYTNARFQ